VSPADRRDWLAAAPVCQALGPYGIVHVGVAVIKHPYSVKRPDLSGTFVMVCTGGEGEVWLEGKWESMGPGMACLAPPHAFHAYRSMPRREWKIAWVRYQEPEGALPIVNARAPVLTFFPGWPLAAAVEGLYYEAGGTASPAAMQLWADLIQHYARTFAEPWRTDDRLREVWRKVAADPAAGWSLEKLARHASMSPKHLRRLCLQSLGRSPARQVTTLRLQRAVVLLTTSSLKVEAIAREIGYKSLYTFSHTFKKFTGRRPSEYRLAAGRAGLPGSPQVSHSPIPPASGYI
jgi:AraC-like DNA-binding protein